MKIPRQIGRYQIEKVLGHGGMAVVFLAHDPDLKRHVAIKLLPRQFVFSGEMRARFIHEARIVAALRHQAIVPIYDFGEFDEQPYLIMPYMPGGSLTTRLPGPQPAAVVASIVERLAPALDKAHAQGIIHRDLKPDNVLFDEDGFPYLADFGIARLAEATQSMTVIGTPAYMSPEQVSGDRQLDGRSDIYALGVIVFEMLTGRPPYEADSPAKQMFKHVHEPVPNILSVRPDLPPVCQEVIARSMAKSPDARYAKAVHLAQTLAQALPQGFAGPVAIDQPGPVSDEPGPAVQTGTPTAALTSEPTALVEGDGRSLVPERPVSSRERIDRILRGNNRTVGLAVLILLALLCGGMLLVPSIWSALLNPDGNAPGIRKTVPPTELPESVPEATLIGYLKNSQESFGDDLGRLSRTAQDRLIPIEPRKTPGLWKKPGFWPTNLRQTNGDVWFVLQFLTAFVTFVTICLPL